MDRGSGRSLAFNPRSRLVWANGAGGGPVVHVSHVWTTLGASPRSCPAARHRLRGIHLSPNRQHLSVGRSHRLPRQVSYRRHERGTVDGNSTGDHRRDRKGPGRSAASPRADYQLCRRDASRVCSRNDQDCLRLGQRVRGAYVAYCVYQW